MTKNELKIKKDIKEIKEKIKEKFPTSNPKRNTRNKRFVQIRVTKNLKVKELIDSNIFDIVAKKKDTRYSGAYNTVFISFNNSEYAIVVSDANEKINSESVKNKQLTPQKLNITGSFNDPMTLLKKLKKEITKIKKELVLNEKAKNAIKSKDDEILFLLLNKLLNMSLDNKLTMTKDEMTVLKLTSAIFKDFGECLTALFILNKKEIKSVSFSNSESNENFDLIEEFNDGLINRINVKSGDGSGQSVKNLFSSHQLLSLKNDNNFNKQSVYSHYSNILTILSSNKKGINKILESAEEFSMIDDKLGELLLEMKKVFFNNKEFKIENLSKKEIDFEEYKEKITKMLNKKGLKIVGVPKGTKDLSANILFETLETPLENAVIFTIGTFISNFHQDKVINHIVNNLIVTPVRIVHISNLKNKILFKEPSYVSYNFKYWASFSSPLRNILGLKAIIK